MSVTFSCTPEGDHRPFTGSPSCNFANGNAAGILDLLGLDVADLFGRVEPAALPALRRRIVRALNSPAGRSHLVCDGYEQAPGHGVAVVEEATGVARIERRGCRGVFGGCTDEQVVRRLHELLALVVWAQENGCGMGWS